MDKVESYSLFGLSYLVKSSGANMYRITLTALVLLLLPCLPIRLSAQSQAQTGAGKSSTVSGRATSKGGTFTQATVYLQPAQSSNSQSPAAVRTVSLNGSPPITGTSATLTVRTDDNGDFKITGVPAGRYRIFALPTTLFRLGGEVSDDVGIPLSIGEGENIENLELEIKRGGVISGRLTISNRPVVEEQVNLFKLDKNGKPAPIQPDLTMGRTDDRGQYRIYGLPDGRYLVCVGTSPSYGRVLTGLWSTGLTRIYYPGVTDQAEAKVVEVVDGSENLDIDFDAGEPKKVYNISGRVVFAENGQPVREAVISHIPMADDGRSMSNMRSSSVRSNAKGEFILTDVLPGKHGIFVRPDPVNEVIGEIEVCEVSDSDVSGIEVKVRPGSVIAGKLVIEGTSDPAVLSNLTQIQLSFFTSTFDIRASTRQQVMVNPEGAFRVGAIVPGMVEVGLVTGSRGFSILRIERDGAQISPQDRLELAPGENISNLRIVVGYNQGEVNR
jgi:cytoskeletal protein CcmA (bactofilin family)